MHTDGLKFLTDKPKLSFICNIQKLEIILNVLLEIIVDFDFSSFLGFS